VQLLLCVCTLYRRMKPAPSLITSANHRCVSLQLGHQRCGCQQMSRVKSTQLLADIRRSRDHAESAFNTESFADNLCRVQVPSLPPRLCMRRCLVAMRQMVAEKQRPRAASSTCSVRPSFGASVPGRLHAPPPTQPLAGARPRHPIQDKYSAYITSVYEEWYQQETDTGRLSPATEQIVCAARHPPFPHPSSRPPAFYQVTTLPH